MALSPSITELTFTQRSAAFACVSAPAAREFLIRAMVANGIETGYSGLGGGWEPYRLGSGKGEQA